MPRSVLSSASPPDTDAATDRKTRAQTIVAAALGRMAGGEILGDQEILAAHPELRAELLVELELARHIRIAYHEARRAGQTPDPLQILRPSDLEKPIDFGSDGGDRDSGP